MSEGSAPAAPAAPSSPATTAPATPVEGAKTTAPVDPLAELDAAISKAGLKYKSSGKEKPVTSLKELLRKAEIADGFQSKQAELIERQKRIEAAEDRDARLKNARTPRERVAILREFAGDAFDEAAEEAIIERIEREKAMSGLTPTERAAREEAERYRAQLEQYEAEKQQAAEAEKQRAEKAELDAVRHEAGQLAVKALTSVGLPKEAAPDMIRRIGVLAGRAVELGLEVDPADIAAKAVSMAAQDFRAYTAKAQGHALLEFLGDDVAQRVSRAWMAKVQGRQAAPPAQMAPAPTPQSQSSGARVNPFAEWSSLVKGK